MGVKKNIAVSDSGFIFNPTTGDSFSTNPIGLEILKLLKEGNSLDEIKKHIVSKYTVDGDTFEKDYYDFLSQLQKSQIVEENK